MRDAPNLPADRCHVACVQLSDPGTQSVDLGGSPVPEMAPIVALPHGAAAL